MEMSKFKITDKKGIHLTFKNGMTASVQFGYGNHCSNRFKKVYDGEDIESKSAAFLAWDENEKDVCEEKGWLSADEVVDELVKIKNMRSDKQ